MVVTPAIAPIQARKLSDRFPVPAKDSITFDIIVWILPNTVRLRSPRLRRPPF
ncbi:hypothetical protein [Nostoc sp.]|uniref:hypothetical protein n=1 Tax=Nostoc sp. TaxID=1180 RepID=UPI002FF5A891